MKRLVEEIWVPAVLLALAAVGVLLVHAPVSGVDFEFSKAVGHALIVAGILSVTVDVYVKRRLVREVSHDTFKYLIGLRLPEELQDKIQEIAETKLVRHDWHFDYKLSHVKGAPDKVKLVAELRFCVENISNRSQEYEQRLFLATYTEPVIIEFRCDSEDADARYALDGQSIAEQMKAAGPGQDNLFVGSVGKRIKLKPKKGNPKLKYEFRARYSQVLPATHINTFTLSSPGIPTRNIFITADYPEEFLFNASGTSTNKDRWDDNRIFLDGEHIFVGWTKVK